MKLRAQVLSLQTENTALKERLAAMTSASRAMNTSIVHFSSLYEVVAAVAQNVKHLDQLNRERVLLAVACLYGIIGPQPPKPKRARP